MLATEKPFIKRIWWWWWWWWRTNCRCIIWTGTLALAVEQEIRRVMDKMLTDLQVPMDIADECMLQREKRTDIDQCHDEVEKCLSKVRSPRRHPTYNHNNNIFRQNNNNNNNNNNNHDDICIAVIYGASHVREFTAVPLTRSAPGGRQLVGQAVNLTFESACIGCYRPNIRPSPCIITQP